MPLLKDQPDLSVKMVLDTKSRQKQRAWTRLCGRQVADVPMLKIYVCVYMHCFVMNFLVSLCIVMISDMLLCIVLNSFVFLYVVVNYCVFLCIVMISLYSNEL